MSVTRTAAVLGCLMAAPCVARAQACQTPPPTGETRFFIAPVAVGVRDTAVVARLCLAATGKGVGSYMATLTYDSTKLRVLRVEVTGGMQVANSRIAGTIRLAGASPAGFASGQLASLIFKPIGAKALSKISLVVDEVNTPAGLSLMDKMRAQGWPADAPRRGARPTVDSISPRAAEVGEERVTDLVLYGKGFAPADNTVLFDGVEVTGLLSEARGTIVRFAAPTRTPVGGGASTRRVQAGRVKIRLKHAGGTSNAVVFTVKGGDW